EANAQTPAIHPADFRVRFVLETKKGVLVVPQEAVAELRPGHQIPHSLCLLVSGFSRTNIFVRSRSLMKYELAVYPLLLVTGVFASAQPRPAATLIVANATVYTVDKQHPKADAVAVMGDRIVAVGSRAEIDLWRGPQTKVIDAGGKLVLPGFNDAHVHFIDGGAQLDEVNLTDAASPEELARQIAD